MQTSMRVKTRATVMRMQTALTQWEVSTAPATLATLEMGSTVQVRKGKVMQVSKKSAFVECDHYCTIYL